MTIAFWIKKLAGGKNGNANGSWSRGGIDCNGNGNINRGVKNRNVNGNGNNGGVNGNANGNGNKGGENGKGNRGCAIGMKKKTQISRPRPQQLPIACWLLANP